MVLVVPGTLLMVSPVVWLFFQHMNEEDLHHSRINVAFVNVFLGARNHRPSTIDVYDCETTNDCALAVQMRIRQRIT